MNQSKKAAGEKAVDYIKSGMTVGLGSGSTVYYMLQKLGRQVRQGLDIKGVSTSTQTSAWAKEFGIPLTDLTDGVEIDIAIDGADEIDPECRLIKGGGGCLVREKIVGFYAKRFIVIAGSSKMVDKLGSFPLPVEILPFGHEITAGYIQALGAKTSLRRQGNGQPFISDNGNYIYDCDFGLLENPHDLNRSLHGVVGVVETGLFLDMAHIVIIGEGRDTKVMKTVKSDHSTKSCKR
ncbi:ribose-5-phosphate isomerase RpiA [Virgibacillus halophilus]|uniref:Ribose-5-phosphate isomerase A n=1 Tax=Tigheibacillus halophilus TaxID=361280 RepID=A0ABU5C267_9BACI|nr:ribose-5-phosphate isomerase RpiA [Virgibacillus halophilus]